MIRFLRKLRLASRLQLFSPFDLLVFALVGWCNGKDPSVLGTGLMIGMAAVLVLLVSLHAYRLAFLPSPSLRSRQ